MAKKKRQWQLLERINDDWRFVSHFATRSEARAIGLATLRPGKWRVVSVPLKKECTDLVYLGILDYACAERRLLQNKRRKPIH